jgi:hypothetical protein
LKRLLQPSGRGTVLRIAGSLTFLQTEAEAARESDLIAHAANTGAAVSSAGDAGPSEGRISLICIAGGVPEAAPA